MPQEPNALEASPGDEELSDYLEVLSCMRKRFEMRGMSRALNLIEQLDDAILQAIENERPQPKLRIVK